MTYTPDSSGFVTTPPPMRQVADRMGSISQRAMLCHRGWHERRQVIRWSHAKVVEINHLPVVVSLGQWVPRGNKCKHCGRWV
jgi:hypothetical protein